MTTAYYAFYLKIAATEGIPPKEVKFKNYYIFGFSL